MKRKFMLYIMEICVIISLLSILLPWISYGVGSKTGLDIGRMTVKVILISGVLSLLFFYIYFKTNKIKKAILYFVCLISSIMFLTYLFEFIRLTYQTTITKNLPVEMFGVAALAMANIHIGYGIWLGLIASFIPFLVSLILVKNS